MVPQTQLEKLLGTRYNAHGQIKEWLKGFRGAAGGCSQVSQGLAYIAEALQLWYCISACFFIYFLLLLDNNKKL